MDDGLETTDWFDTNGWTGREGLVGNGLLDILDCKEKVGWIWKGDWEEDEDCEGTKDGIEGNGNEGDAFSFFNWEYGINGENCISREKSNETPGWLVGVDNWFFVYK